jgi:exopolysaccharide biosynthesis protein
MKYNIILSGIITTTLLIVSGCSSNTSFTTKNYNLQGYENDSIVLITPTSKVWGFSSLYSSWWLTSEEYKEQLSQSWKNDCAVINGSYFDYTSWGSFQPAGTLLLYNGIKNIDIISSTIIPSQDPNLWVHVHYNTTNNILSFSDDKAPIRGIWFFAGPMIIENNVINPKLSEDISHRNKPYERTFMIQLPDQKTVIWVSTKKTTLSELAEKLNNIYKDQIISVVNLDGGPSTTLNHNDISFDKNNKLPLWFSICSKE